MGNLENSSPKENFFTNYTKKALENLKSLFGDNEIQKGMSQEFTKDGTLILKAGGIEIFLRRESDIDTKVSVKILDERKNSINIDGIPSLNWTSKKDFENWLKGLLKNLKKQTSSDFYKANSEFWTKLNPNIDIPDNWLEEFDKLDKYIFIDKTYLAKFEEFSNTILEIMKENNLSPSGSLDGIISNNDNNNKAIKKFSKSDILNILENIRKTFDGYLKSSPNNPDIIDKKTQLLMLQRRLCIKIAVISKLKNEIDNSLNFRYEVIKINKEITSINNSIDLSDEIPNNLTELADLFKLLLSNPILLNHYYKLYKENNGNLVLKKKTPDEGQYIITEDGSIVITYYGPAKDIDKKDEELIKEEMKKIYKEMQNYNQFKRN